MQRRCATSHLCQPTAPWLQGERSLQHPRWQRLQLGVPRRRHLPRQRRQIVCCAAAAPVGQAHDAGGVVPCGDTECKCVCWGGGGGGGEYLQGRARRGTRRLQQTCPAGWAARRAPTCAGAAAQHRTRNVAQAVRFQQIGVTALVGLVWHHCRLGREKGAVERWLPWREGRQQWRQRAAAERGRQRWELVAGQEQRDQLHPCRTHAARAPGAGTASAPSRLDAVGRRCPCCWY